MERFRPIDRDTPMLMPPDMRDWVTGDDLVHFVLAAVNEADFSKAKTNTRGTGSQQYPPGMMVAVMLYCYSTGVFSSRQIEAMTYRHVSVRYLAANEHPDHDTICKFRRENGALVKSVFMQVLKMAGLVGLTKMGSVCIDGTKMGSVGAKKRTKNLKKLKIEERRLEKQVQELLDLAEQADSKKQDDGMTLPKELKRRQELLERVREAKRLLHEQTEARAEQVEAEREEWRQDPFGDMPPAANPKPQAKDQINPTDPESRLMPQAGKGFVQGYNAQLAVSAEHHSVIVAAEVCTESNDRKRMQPMVEAALASGIEIRNAAFDAGYDNARHIRNVEAKLGVRVTCPTQALSNKKEVGKGKQKAARNAARAIRKHARKRAQSKEGMRLLRLRSTTVEPIFGIIKSALGFRRFHLKGLEKVNIEWQIIATAFNCRRLAPIYAKQRKLS